MSGARKRGRRTKGGRRGITPWTRRNKPREGKTRTGRRSRGSRRPRTGRSRRGRGARKTPRRRNTCGRNGDNRRTSKKRLVGHLRGGPVRKLLNRGQEASQELRERLSPVPEDEGKELGTHVAEKCGDFRVGQNIQLERTRQRNQVTLGGRSQKERPARQIRRKYQDLRTALHPRTGRLP